jgi:AcrR family transcriptional regulator
MASKRLSAGERHSQIAKIAAELFAKKGFNGVTTREIARRAGVSEAILFRHFPNKEALYTEIINQKIEVQTELFNLESVKNCSDETVFSQLARWFMKQVEQDNTFVRLMLYSALEDHKLADVFLSSRTSLLFDFLLKYFTKRIDEGVFKKMKPAVLVQSFLGMFFHFILSHELFKTPVEFRISKDEAVRDFVRIFLEGVTIKK